jgi:hypothetical protein
MLKEKGADCREMESADKDEGKEISEEKVWKTWGCSFFRRPLYILLRVFYAVIFPDL